MCIELDLKGIQHARQVPIAISYKGRPVNEYRLDLMVEDMVVVEIKCVERLDPIFSLLTYLRASNK
jgi:GxxExxY protein